MPNGRPRREDIPEDTDPCDVLHELRLLDYRFDQFLGEFREYRAEINGDHRWLRSFRARVNEVRWFATLIIPVALATLLALHLTGATP